MEELQHIYREKGTELINDLLSDYVIVTEKLSGSSFAFERHANGLQFFKGTSQKPINLVDRTLMMYYEPAIAHINAALPYGHGQLSPGFERLPEGWRFCFQYFVHNEPGVIRYTKLPKNNLVLTHIHVKGPNGKVAKIIDDPRVIRDWAQALDVTPLQPFFAGQLTDEQRAKIREFISIPIEDQEELFGTESFAEYLMQVLNPGITATTLHGSLKDPIDSLIFKFIKPGSGKTVLARVIDPYTKTMMKEREPVDFRRAPADINEIILLDLLAFIEERGVKQSDAMSGTPEERYIELVSNLFNDYVKQQGNSLEGVRFDRADFSSAPEFGINLDLVSNKTTRQLVSDSESLADLYKVMLGSLRKKRDPERAGAVMTKSVVADFNHLVDKINTIMHKEDDGKFKTFEEYLQMKQVNESFEDPIDAIIEERTLNFSQFINLNKINLTEALNVPHTNPGKQRVNIIVGRFQPFTLGHAKVFKQIHDQNGLPVVVFTVRGKKPDPEKSPFSEELQQAMFAKMQKEYPFLEAMYVVPSAAVDMLFSVLRPAYEPVLWGFGTDRKKQYDFMIHKPEYREQLGVDPEFNGYEIKRADEDISASKVREALKLDDKRTFEKMTPKSMHDMWVVLQDVLVPVIENKDFNILEKTFNIELTQGEPKGELLGIIDSTSDDYISIINKVKISLSASSIDAAIDKKCENGNINESSLKEIIKSILRPGWIGGDKYDEFINLNAIELAKTNHNKYDLNIIIQHYSKFLNSQVLTRLLNESGRIGGISVGKGEYFLAMLTDYTRPPKGQKGDLWFDGSVEVKDNDARLGGTDTKRDGTQSVKEFCEIIGLSYDKDSYLLDGLKNQIIPFIKDNETTLFNNKSLIERAINSMSNYDVDVTNSMVTTFRTAYKNPSQFESYLGALQLYSYNLNHNHKQIVFIDTNRMILSSFTPTNNFSDTWNFVQNNLKFSASSWHGRHAQNKTGLSVNLR